MDKWEVACGSRLQVADGKVPFTIWFDHWALNPVSLLDATEDDVLITTALWIELTIARISLRSMEVPQPLPAC